MWRRKLRGRQSQPVDRKISSEDMKKTACGDYTERCDDVAIVSRDERTVVIKEKSLEHNTRRSDILSKQGIKRSSVVDIKNDEK